jgi:XTP/dITP diphosphohydrolase
MREIVLATNNMHKCREFSNIFGDEIKLVTLKEIKFEDEIIEKGKTFIDNSLIKCEAVYKKTGRVVMADDSGLCVRALDGAPGVYSARYGKKDFTDKDRYMYLLKNLDKNGDLSASFVCALVLYINPNRIYVVQEELSGLIDFNPRGDNGFGYDPVFFVPQYNKTVAELDDDVKNTISHRGRAASIMKNILDKIEF